jgi:hypothetical protein
MASEILEQHSLRVEIDSTRGGFEVVEKGTGTRWTGDPFTGSPGVLTLRERVSGRTLPLDLLRAGTVRMERLGPLAAAIHFEGLRTDDGHPVEGAAVHVRLTLQEEEAELAITIDEVTYAAARFDFVSLLFPQRQFALRTHVADGYLAIPYHQGFAQKYGSGWQP